MNYSGNEHSDHLDDAVLIEAGLELLPLLGKSLFAAISQLGHTYRLTTSQVKLLLHLGTRSQMTIGEIAAALGVSMPAASELVDRLVDAGHLVRAADPADRRKVIIAATPTAERIGAELCQLRRAQLRAALDQLEPADRPLFIRSLQALVAGLHHGMADMPPCPAAPTAVHDAVTANGDISPLPDLLPDRSPRGLTR
jgi:DNA-binding MarR family transcriptional regulator